MVGNLIGIVLQLRAKIRQPVIDGHVILEAVIVSIYKVHLANQGGQITVFSGMMSHRSVAPVKLVGIGDCASAVCIQPGQQGHS
jgi:hypothetical protein